ncbi:MAG: hypothetical protein COA94_04960 [Rickettsiales bacterium]|nr:MAG: hypothetical protein COA94_04960 [Rickettsiales bacterium]
MSVLVQCIQDYDDAEHMSRLIKKGDICAVVDVREYILRVITSHYHGTDQWEVVSRFRYVTNNKNRS